MLNRYNLIDNVRNKKPLVHHITNYVTVNDCANITLEIGASPVMADEINEVKDFVRIASSLVINIGTINQRTFESIIEAGKEANQNAVPVILDPVGVGASQFRNDVIKKIIETIKLTCIRGNVSEIRFLAGLSSQTRGVDASINDEMNLDDTMVMAQQLASKLDCVIVISGAIDVVACNDSVTTISNGQPIMGQVTGTGCMLTSLLGSFIGANNDSVFNASIEAVLSMGIAGDIACQESFVDGNASFKMALHDAISNMNSAKLEARAKVK
jgi:hydroxyethylthiazole kinase